TKMLSKPQHRRHNAKNYVAKTSKAPPVRELKLRGLPRTWTLTNVVVAPCSVRSETDQQQQQQLVAMHALQLNMGFNQLV
uniref:hypothetical protein n=1 Tax=Acinetobacter baumannii TaxID=470 RepID=UPI003391DD76